MAQAPSRVAFRGFAQRLPRIGGLALILSAAILAASSVSEAAAPAMGHLTHKTMQGHEESLQYAGQNFRQRRNWRRLHRRRLRQQRLEQMHRQKRSHQQRDHADHSPGKKPHKGRPLCIGGKVKAGRCRCRKTGVRRLVRAGVFSCIRNIGRNPPATTANLPVRPDTPPPRPSSTQERTVPALTPPHPALSSAQPPRFAPDQVLVSLDRGAPAAIAAQVGQTHGLQMIASWSLGRLRERLVLYRIPDGRSVATIVEALRTDPRIREPQPNFHYLAQRDTRSTASERTELQYAFAKLNLPAAHRMALGRGSLVAVIDSGIDESHPDLARAVARRFDATAGGNGAKGDHGTAIAGIISAGGRVRGVAPEARLLAISAFEPSHAGEMVASTASLTRGLDQALENGARIINMSVAGPPDPLLGRGIAATVQAGAIIVAAAGNAGPGAPPAYPAAYPGVIAVTATNPEDQLYGSANRGRYIAISAPGVDILAAALGGGHQFQTGTSFAAAHVSGLAALLLELDPDLTAEKLRFLLIQAARDLGAPGRDTMFGSGLADGAATLRLLERGLADRCRREDSAAACGTSTIGLSGSIGEDASRLRARRGMD